MHHLIRIFVHICRKHPPGTQRLDNVAFFKTHLILPAFIEFNLKPLWTNSAGIKVMISSKKIDIFCNYPYKPMTWLGPYEYMGLDQYLIKVFIDTTTRVQRSSGK